VENDSVIDEHQQYIISLSDDGSTMLFNWNHLSGLSALDFAQGIMNFASRCETHRPARAVIDARQLDQTSEAVNWLRAKVEVEGLDDYEPWWAESVLPLYHDAGITSLTVATGDPNAPGEVPSPPGVRFKMGYFFDLDQARNWTGTKV